MDRNQMKSTAQGLANEVGGKVKKNVGKVIGNEKMEAEGAAKESLGHAQRAANQSTRKFLGLRHVGPAPR